MMQQHEEEEEEHIGHVAAEDNAVEFVTICGESGCVDEEDECDDSDEDAWHRARRGGRDEDSGDVPGRKEREKELGLVLVQGGALDATAPPGDSKRSKRKKRKRGGRKRGRATAAAGTDGDHQGDGLPMATRTTTTHTSSICERRQPDAGIEQTCPTVRDHDTRHDGNVLKGLGPPRTKQRGLDPATVERLCQELAVETPDQAGVRLAEVLHERKIYKIGMERTLKMFSETMALERQGGMSVRIDKEGQRFKRRTSGGIFLTLLKSHASKEELSTINQQEQQYRRNKSKSKLNREEGIKAQSTENEMDSLQNRPKKMEEAVRYGEDEQSGLVGTTERAKPKRHRHKKRKISDIDLMTVTNTNIDDNPFGQVW